MTLSVAELRDARGGRGWGREAADAVSLKRDPVLAIAQAAARQIDHAVAVDSLFPTHRVSRVPQPRHAVRYCKDALSRGIHSSDLLEMDALQWRSELRSGAPDAAVLTGQSQASGLAVLEVARVVDVEVAVLRR